MPKGHFPASAALACATGVGPHAPPHIVEAIDEGSIQLLINTTQGTKEIRDSYSIRRHALLANIPYFTTIAAGLAVTGSLELRSFLSAGAAQVRSVQEWHARAD